MLEETAAVLTSSSDVPELAPVPVHPDPAAELLALVEADLLVEDVSIDGMCGVY